MAKVLFAQLDAMMQEDRLLLPRYVSVTKNPDEESGEQIEWRHVMCQQLSEDIQHKLVSKETRSIIKQIGQQFALSMIQLSNIARAIRSYYFGELSLENFVPYIAQEIPIEITQAQKITEIVHEKIFNAKVAVRNRTEQGVAMLLIQALEKYPRVSDQQITTERIQVKSEKEPVRGTVRHWIRAYRDAVGIREHSAIERGQFLFQSENAKKLPTEEREKVAVLLKALDDNENLSIDTQKQIILFPISTRVLNTKSGPVVAIPVPQQVMPLSQRDVSMMTSKLPEQPNQNNQIAPKQRGAMPNESQYREMIPQAQNTLSQAKRSMGQERVLQHPETASSAFVSPMKKYNFAQVQSTVVESAPAPTSEIPTQRASTRQNPQEKMLQDDKNMRSQGAMFSRPTPGIHLDPPIPTAVEQTQFQFSSKHIMPAEMNAVNNQVHNQMETTDTRSHYEAQQSTHQTQGGQMSQQQPASNSQKEVWDVPASIQNVVDLRDFNDE